MLNLKIINMKENIQQTEQQKNKLGFKKFQIAQLQNPQMIIGGNDPVRTDDTMK